MENPIFLHVYEYLKGHKKKSVSLDELSSLFGGDVLYVEFAASIEKLIHSDILIPIKGAGFSLRTPRIPYKYKINNAKIREEFKQDIERMAIQLCNKINLEYYFSHSQPVWEADKENIVKLNQWLQDNGLPEHTATAPERSYQIFGDEKFIDEKYGKQLLQRVRLYKELKISSDVNPAMFFINNRKINEAKKLHLHLIIENRTAFYVLANVLRASALTSVIYGAGFDILSSITIFEKQIDLTDSEHRYFYFGDLDYTGISIWHYVTERVNAVPGVDFYRELLKQEAAYGKEYQQPNFEALEHFLDHFETAEQERMKSTLESGQYYPQEALESQELQKIFIKHFGEEIYGD